MRKILLIINVLIIMSCSSKTQDDRQNLFFISESFQNRFIDDGTTQVHDSNDIGFYKNHFQPEELYTQISENFDSHKLKRITGIEWQEISSFDSVFNFKNFISPNTNRVVYLAEYFFQENNTTKLLTLGSDDGIKIWHNGKAVYTRNVWRGIKVDDDLIILDVQKGWNTILYKISQGDGGWGLYRSFKKINLLEKLLVAKADDIYNDLLESAIFNEGELLRFKIDPRSLVDIYHQIHISIIDFGKDKSGQLIYNKTFVANDLPDGIKLPDSFSGEGLFSLKAINNEKESYSEEIPVFYWDNVYSHYNRITNDTVTVLDENEWAKKNAFIKLWSKGKSASTRMLAESLKNVLLYKNKAIQSGFNIMGYRSAFDGTIQTYGLFYPPTLLPTSLVYIMHGKYTKDSDYWDSYEGGSHSTMIQRIAESTDNNVGLVMTHGRGIKNYLEEAEEELPLINYQLQDRIEIPSSHILVWSKGATALFELLKMIEFEIKSIGIISPDVPDDVTEMQQLISYMKINHPKLRLFVRHGLNDEDSPISRTRKFVDLLRKNDIEVDYKEIPYSTHWNYIYDQEKEYYQYVTTL